MDAKGKGAGEINLIITFAAAPQQLAQQQPMVGLCTLESS
jgi:hypothetical protein